MVDATTPSPEQGRADGRLVLRRADFSALLLLLLLLSASSGAASAIRRPTFGQYGVRRRPPALTHHGDAASRGRRNRHRHREWDVRTRQRWREGVMRAARSAGARRGQPNWVEQERWGKARSDCGHASRCTQTRSAEERRQIDGETAEEQRRID
eukprot:gene5505-16744_t